MTTTHSFTEYERNLICMALDLVIPTNAFDEEDVDTAKLLMARLPKEAKEQNEKHNSH